ncbi:MAG: DUF364 domain-containing protein [Methanothrix sp.]|jgi:uncharacterized protein (DUF4213/DUF364 family)|nr:DUF364 domain-containing protein [Methanothrix sp.]
MQDDDLLQEAKRCFIAELESQSNSCGAVNLQDELVVIRPLNAAEAIGEAGREDFPIIRGKEVLMQAVYRGAVGQAFTAASGGFRGSLGDVLEMPLDGPFERAVLIATMNAVLRYLGKIEGTVHCRDDGPGRCKASMSEWIKEQGAKRVGLVGLQPALLEALVQALGPERVMVSDLSAAGADRCQVRVLDGMQAEKMLESCQLFLITGSTFANRTIDDLMNAARGYNSRVVFYGTTAAGVAYLLGLERWCPCST